MVLLSEINEILSVSAVSYPPPYHRPMQPLQSVRLEGVEVDVRFKMLTEEDCKRITHLVIEVVTGIAVILGLIHLIFQIS